MAQLSFENKASLRKYIDEQGNVDYAALDNDPWFHEQIQRIQITDISKLSYNEEFVFWLNAYNILTIKTVHSRLHANSKWKGNSSYFSKFKFFILTKHNVGGRKISLYNLENKILRKKFKDPRMHFAINCASKSCPVLPNRLFNIDDLDETLEFLTENFINDEKHVRFDVTTNILYLNQIFKWYKKDFRVSGGVINFINKYYQNASKIVQNPKIKYTKYNLMGVKD